MMCTKISFMEAYYIILHSKIEENAIFNGRISSARTYSAIKNRIFFLPESGRRHDNSDH